MIETAAFSAFEPSPEQREIAELAADVAEREIAPHIAQWDREHTFPVDLYAKLAAAGVLGMLVGERYGGGGVDYVSYALALEELARVDAGTAVTVSVHSMIATVIDRLGTDAQKDRYLPKLAQEAYLGAFALTEPDVGSDAGNLRATAHADGDGYVLRGRKQWCTNGSYAGVVMGMFRTGGAGPKGISAFLIEPGTPGMVVEKRHREARHPYQQHRRPRFRRRARDARRDARRAEARASSAR